MESQEKDMIEKNETSHDGLEDFIIEGTAYRTTLNNTFKTRKTWKLPDPKIVNSVIPGTIVDVIAAKGQNLKEGDPLIILEAMKMRNVIAMPIDGTIKSINVEEGVKVPKGIVLAEIL